MFRYSLLFLFFQLLCPFFTLESIVKQGLINLLEVKCGEEIPVKIQLTNCYDIPQKYTLTLCDYFYQATGEVSYSPLGKLARSNADWIRLYTPSLILPPKGEGNVFYDIKVPNDKSLAGSYWSVILIEPQEQLPNLENPSEGINLIVKIRYAYQIVTTIAGGNAKLQVQDQQIRCTDSKRLLSVDVKNIGNLFLDPTAHLKLYNAEGNLVDTLQAQPQKILPGCSIRYYFDIQSVQNGTYSALLFLDSRQKNVFCYRLEVNI